MRFIFGVLVGYSMRGKEKSLLIVLATMAFIVYIVVLSFHGNMSHLLFIPEWSIAVQYLLLKDLSSSKILSTTKECTLFE